MLTIRLQRTGKKNQADFRIVLTEKENPVTKKSNEILGSYNPRKKTFQVNKERVDYWLSQRVQLSPTVHNLFVTQGLQQGSKVKAFSVPKKAAEPAAASTPAESVAAPAAEPAAETPPAEVAAEESAPIEESKIDETPAA